MDTEQLIHLVYERQSLWDQGSKNYHNRDVAKKLWKEIAEQTNSTSKFFKQYYVFLLCKLLKT